MGVSERGSHQEYNKPSSTSESPEKLLQTLRGKKKKKKERKSLMEMKASEEILDYIYKLTKMTKSDNIRER